MKTLYLNDLLHLTREQLINTRVRFNKHHDGTSIIKVLRSNPSKILDGNYWNNKTYQVGQYSICLVQLDTDRWMLYHIGRVTGLINIPAKSGVGCTYEELSEYSHLYKRVIVRFHNKAQQMFRNGDRIIPQLEVCEILPDVYTGIDFPGYDKVSLTWGELNKIVNGDYPSYQNALRKQKAVYVLTDKQTGKLYIGSATSAGGMLLDRWTNYVKTGHGGNKALKQLVEKEGIEYIQNCFQYTILENFNQGTDDEYVIERESYWKAVFQTRTFGYNCN